MSSHKKLLVVIVLLANLCCATGHADCEQTPDRALTTPHAFADQWIPLPMVMDAEVLVDNSRYWLMLTSDTRPIEIIAEEMGIGLPFDLPNLIIEKSSYSLLFLCGNAVVKRYPLAIGKYAFEGPKFQEGDARTPEGEYYICKRLTQESLTNPLTGTRWLHVSYPNSADARMGLETGLIDQKEHDAIVLANQNGVMPPQNTDMGGGIGIHGGYFDDLGKSTKTWTGGCIGMRNADIEEIFDHTPLTTPVLIMP